MLYEQGGIFPWSTCVVLEMRRSSRSFMAIYGSIIYLEDGLIDWGGDFIVKMLVLDRLKIFPNKKLLQFKRN